MKADLHPAMTTMPCIHVRLDRCRLSSDSLPIWVKHEIKRRNLVTGEGDIVSFCGLLVQKNELFVFLPRGIELENNRKEAVDLATLMTGCVERYAKESATRVKADDADEGIQGGGQLTVIRELLEDYRLNGLYVSSHRQVTVNQGRTDWKRTINRIIPLPDKDGSPVYPVLLSNRHRFTHNTIIAEIHASVICRLDLMFGWWLTGSAHGRVAQDLAETPGLLALQEYCLSMLKRERSFLYSDRNIRLICNLIKYLESSSAEAESPVVVGLRDFHWAWEHMLGDVLMFRTKLNGELPMPVYYLVDGTRMVAAGKSMRTDIFLEDTHAKRAVVVDAKYYAATSVQNSPGWSDLVKQFFYAKAVRAVRENYHIENVFVFPGTRNMMELVSVESRNGKIAFHTDFPRIWCVYVDPLEVMRHYKLRVKIKTLSEQLLAGKPPNMPVDNIAT